MFKCQKFLEEYKTDTNDFINEFYKKIFNDSIEYWCVIGSVMHHKISYYSYEDVLR